MALIFLGLTECALCRCVLQKTEAITSLSPIADKQHPLYQYFDAGIHVQCFEHWDKKEEVIRIIKEENQKFINSDYFKKMSDKFGKPEWFDEMEKALQSLQ